MVHTPFYTKKGVSYNVIYHVAVEMAPFAKQGGLADVIYGLSKATVQAGLDLEVILPHYQFLKLPFEHDKAYKIEFKRGESNFKISIVKAVIDGISIAFLECVAPHPLFHRDSPYGTYEEEINSFLFFSIAALAYIAHCKKKAIVHLHDWHPSIIATLVKHENHPMVKATVLTIHNLEFQGRCSSNDLKKFGIEANAKMRFEDRQDNQVINLLSSAIIHADQITTVSKSYAEEILTPEYGWWLEGVLWENRHKLTGILNGIDYEHWNPATDSKIPFPFSKDMSRADILEAKHHNKRALQKCCNLPLSHAPLVISVTRLTPQKSPDLILHAMQRAAKLNMQYILIGSAASIELKKRFESTRLPQTHISLGFNEDLSRLAFAGADAILIPSSFEPCGLTQLISMRYGTPPIVRKTGGLKDTVEDIEYSSKPKIERNGFVFNEKDAQSIDWVLDRVQSAFTNKPEEWQDLIIHCLRLDYSWKNSAYLYIKIYKNLGG